MDRLEALGQQISQITAYDIKSMYNQAKNIVLNVSEMEAKVKEATNEDPWGASSSLMQEIAQGTFNFQNFNEIMPCIYSRFMEKETSQWRQIYKTLQLLEYIIKHGSERVVDDARAHISTVKMLRNFHYIDEKGKDQGINVRTRAKELVDLLSDLDRVRTERRKAKANRNKYVGTGNDPMSFTSGGGRYGGFGNEGLASGSSSYGSGNFDNEYSGGGSSFRDTSSRRGYEEYDAGEYEDSSPGTRPQATRRSSSIHAPSSHAQPLPSPPKANQQDFDLLGGFGDDIPARVDSPAPVKPLPPTSSVSLDDEFDDFQSAPAIPAPNELGIVSTSSMTSKGLFDVLDISSLPSSTNPPPPATHYKHTPNLSPQQPMLSTGTPNVSAPPYGSHTAPHSSPPPISNRLQTLSAPVVAKGTPANFADLWDLGVGSSSFKKPANPASAAAGKSIKDLEKEKLQARIWSSGGQAPPVVQTDIFASEMMPSGTPKSGSAIDDNLLL